MKPLRGGFADNAIKNGVAGMCIDGGRIETEDKLLCSKAAPYHATDGSQRTWNPTSTPGMERKQHSLGRWPANVVMGHSTECNDECNDECPVVKIDRQTGGESSCVSRYFKQIGEHNE
jgi:hypothetical protein